jgi:antitoxin VapB
MAEHRKINLDRIAGTAPWLKPRQVKHFTAKIFKSGNSVALRLPAGLGLEPGMEMDLRVEDGDVFSFEPIDRPKRKFNVAKVWGSASDLNLIEDDARMFEERSLFDGGRPDDDIEP